jgi:hypothetical protein
MDAHEIQGLKGISMERPAGGSEAPVEEAEDPRPCVRSGRCHAACSAAEAEDEPGDRVAGR